MISRLQGIIWEKQLSCVELNVHGVGYSVQIPMSTFDALPLEGKECELFIHTQVRDDAIILFGFASRDERRLFELLITVSGVGGKLALSVLSGLPVSSFISAVSAKNTLILSKIPGIGKRTAERIAVELHDKVSKFGVIAATDGTVGSEPVSDAMGDALFALEQLGYKRDQALKALQKVAAELAEDEQNSATLLRLTLKSLNK